MLPREISIRPQVLYFFFFCFFCAMIGKVWLQVFGLVFFGAWGGGYLDGFLRRVIWGASRMYISKGRDLIFTTIFKL